jgi:bifunctional UDP-N-acetylglucosamine pyrophosphorylase/glucosamine-1-phosphate N-acetyltransferase
MKSSKPKVLHEILNRPMLLYVIDAVKTLHPREIVIVIGSDSEEIKQAVRDRSIRYVTQAQPLGTGHALKMAKSKLQETTDSTLLILNGDCPLITPAALQALVKSHKGDNNDLSFLTFLDSSLSGYGRILRDDKNRVVGIVEDKHAPSDKKNIRELNGGVYVMESKILDYLGQLEKNNFSGEYYLTDIVKISSCKGDRVNTYTCNPEVIRGVNTKDELQQISDILSRRAAS